MADSLTSGRRCQMVRSPAGGPGSMRGEQGRRDGRRERRSVDGALWESGLAGEEGAEE